MSIQIKKSFFIFLFIATFLLPNHSNGQGILTDNIYLPVLITLSDGQGSGFYWTDRQNTYLVTAAHVLFDNNKLQADSIEVISYSPQGQIILQFDLASLMRSNNLRKHPTHDIALIMVARDIDENLIEFSQYVKKVQWLSAGFIKGSAVTLFDKVQISNDVYVLGYPSSLGIQNIPQFDYTQPLLRKGTIAGKNLKNNTIIIDCPVYPGNSGGPVIEIGRTESEQTMRLVGVVSEFIPFEETWLNLRYGLTNRQWSNSGYAVVIPMDIVYELINK